VGQLARARWTLSMRRTSATSNPVKGVQEAIEKQAATCDEEHILAFSETEGHSDASDDIILEQTTSISLLGPNFG